MRYRSLFQANQTAAISTTVTAAQIQIERFPVMSLTVALVDTERIPIRHQAELSDIAQELKALGKGIPGSVVVGERRARDAKSEPPQQNVA